MPSGESPRRLRDVSHLFLSENSIEAPDSTGKQTEASVWLAVERGRSFVRAFLAAGFGAALSRQGMHVTLLEAGGGLPNLGYYFAQEPSRYLSASLDRTAIVSGVQGAGLRFASAPDVTELARFKHEAPFVGYPHIIVIAFSYSREMPGGAFLRSLCNIAGRFSVTGAAADLTPEAIVLFCGDKDADTAGAIRNLYPESVLFSAGPGGGVGSGGIDERFVLPAGYDDYRMKRAAPENAIFDDMATSMLQAVSHRRKKRRGNAAP
jgi:hypothetical protein